MDASNRLSGPRNFGPSTQCSSYVSPAKSAGGELPSPRQLAATPLVFRCIDAATPPAYLSQKSVTCRGRCLCAPLPREAAHTPAREKRKINAMSIEQRDCVTQRNLPSIVCVYIEPYCRTYITQLRQTHKESRLTVDRLEHLSNVFS